MRSNSPSGSKARSRAGDGAGWLSVSTAEDLMALKTVACGVGLRRQADVDHGSGEEVVPGAGRRTVRHRPGTSPAPGGALTDVGRAGAVAEHCEQDGVMGVAVGGDRAAVGRLGPVELLLATRRVA
jgi:hypothetical protein